MNTYDIWWADQYGIEDDNSHKTFYADTPGKAKYQAFLYWGEFFDLSFKDFLRGLKCKCIGRTKPEHFFTKKEDFDRVIKSRGIEFAHMGMKVTVEGKPGVITGSNGSCNLNVLLDGHATPYNCHPYWKMDYFDGKGNMIAEHRDNGGPRLIVSTQ